MGKLQKKESWLQRWMKKQGWTHHRKFIGLDIQSIIMAVLTALTLITTITIGLLLYNRFKMAMKQTAVSNAESMVESTVDKLDAELLNVRQIMNAVNYNIIQENDISSDDFNRQFSLLYEINTDKVQSMALYDSDGAQLVAEPVSERKKGVKASEQDWYTNAEEEIENVHFSLPHIQNLFEDGTYRYYWVISLSRSVDINDGEKPRSGVLLVDMKYSVISNTMKRINESSNGIYYYLCSRDGQMIYHPRRADIDRGYFSENCEKTSQLEDGTYELSLNGRPGNVVVSSVAYTGWKLVGVIPERVQTANINRFRYYIITAILILMMMLLEVNRIISKKISRPILRLNESVKAYEAGGDTDIYIGGSSEIRHLGYSVKKSYEQIENLMQEIIREQTERRKSEMDALQSQINPHFLYNTLESITWMVEAQKNKEAVLMISELARLLRISLSKGRTVIRIADELQHSRSYMNIQLVRYKERFRVEFDIDEEVNDYCTVKLIVQPILENAIYYGVGNMDEDDGGMITVRGEKKGDDIYLSVEDNGMGMSEETVENILKDNNKVPKHGSGVGLINVHNRIQLMFGNEYGLLVYSEPDEGTKIVIHIPAIPFTEENRQQLETQSYRNGRATDETR